jgi:hypothetical protein
MLHPFSRRLVHFRSKMHRALKTGSSTTRTYRFYGIRTGLRLPACLCQHMSHSTSCQGSECMERPLFRVLATKHSTRPWGLALVLRTVTFPLDRHTLHEFALHMRRKLGSSLLRRHSNSSASENSNSKSSARCSPQLPYFLGSV